MSYESEMRRQMEQAAAQEQVDCPLSEDVDAAFAMTKATGPMVKGLTRVRKAGRKSFTKTGSRTAHGGQHKNKVIGKEQY